VPVALSQPRPGAFIWLSADDRGQLRLDQRLIDRGRRRPDPIINLSSLQHLQQLKQGRLIQSHRVMCPFGHRVMCPFARTTAVVSLTTTRWPSPTCSPTPTRPTTYTTSRDITSRPPCAKLEVPGGKEIVECQIRPPDGVLDVMRNGGLVSIRIAAMPSRSSSNRLRLTQVVVSNSSRGLCDSSAGRRVRGRCCSPSELIAVSSGPDLRSRGLGWRRPG
jgi:hypothetical protein